MATVPPAFAISAARSSKRSRRRAPTRSRAPSRANAMAAARPMPAEAPVIATTASFSFTSSAGQLGLAPALLDEERDEVLVGAGQSLERDLGRVAIAPAV